MHVIARTDPHAVRDEVRAAHPDWIAVTRGRRAATALGQSRAVGDLRARAVQLRVHGPGPSRDRHASTRSTASSRTAGRRRGRLLLRALPSRTSRPRPALDCRARPTPRDPARRQFLAWRKARLTELWKHWDATVRAANPDARFIPNGPPDLKTAGELARDSVHRQPGAARPDAPVDQRPPRQGVCAR